MPAQHSTVNTTTDIHHSPRQTTTKTTLLVTSSSKMPTFTMSSSPTPQHHHESSSMSKTKILDTLLSLRSKTMTVLFSLFVLIVALCVIGLSISFPTSFQVIEDNEAKDIAKKSSKSLIDDFKTMSSKLYDYAAWDEPFGIVQREDRSEIVTFFDTYFFCDYLKKTNLHYVSIYFLNGTLFHHSSCFDGSPIVDGLPEELQNLGAFFFENITDPHSRSNGFIVPKKILNTTTLTYQDEVVESSSTSLWEFSKIKNILEVSAMPVQTNDNSQSIGLLVYSRVITYGLIEDMSARTQDCVTIYNLQDASDSSQLQQDLGTGKQIVDYLKTVKGTLITSLVRNSWLHDTNFESSTRAIIQSNKMRVCASMTNADISRLSSYQVFTDFTGEKNIVIRTDAARTTYEASRNTFIYTSVTMVALVIFISISVVVFIEIFVLRRVLKIGNSVRTITTENDISKRVPKLGRDELGKLSFDINHMLTSLEFSHQQLEKDNELMQKLLETTSVEEEKSRCVMNSIGDYIVTVECSSGIIVSMNTAFETKFVKSKKRTSATLNNTAQLANETSLLLGDCIKIEDLKNESNTPIMQQLESHSTNQNSTEIVLFSEVTGRVSVSLSCVRTRMTVREGVIANAYILVMKNLEEQKELKNLLNKQQEKLEEMQKIESLNKVLRDDKLRGKFREFCRNEHSEENVAFLEDVESYKSIGRTRDRSIKQKEMISKYLDEKSMHYLNLSKKEVQVEVKKVKEGYAQLSLFDALETTIKVMILDDSFSRFCTFVNSFSTVSSQPTFDSTDSSGSVFDDSSSTCSSNTQTTTNF